MVNRSSNRHIADRSASSGWNAALTDSHGLSALAGAVIVVLTGVVFSFGGLAFRLTDDMSAWQYIIYRGLGAFAVTAAILAARYRRRVEVLVGSVEGRHIVAGVMLGTISSIFIFALERASVAFVMFLQTLAPLTAAYFSWVMLRERVSRAVLVSTAAALVGVLIMFSATLTDRIDPLGAVAIAIPVIFGLYATLIRGAVQIDAQVPVIVAGATLTTIGAVAATVDGGFAVSLHDALIGLFAGAALLAVPAALLNLATRVVPAPEVALFLMGEVILAPVWVWLFVNESPESTTLLGGAIIFLAVFGLLLWRRQQATRNRTSADPAVVPLS